MVCSDSELTNDDARRLSVPETRAFALLYSEVRDKDSQRELDMLEVVVESLRLKDDDSRGITCEAVNEPDGVARPPMRARNRQGSGHSNQRRDVGWRDRDNTRKDGSMSGGDADLSPG
ncbi:hypothetical protein QBC36DRAFT_379492 [Triangularia setosa]|uniref:Uncharacterized protein n=1 Tax=Triangularia setosa TaxID=2587417 RepID=A0AAN6W838_9PEZI|nr:hypothetical protein QBC36DRAFT_379492 [Podospora setosa]